MSGPASTRYVPISALYGAVARLLRAASLVLALLFVLRVLASLGPLGSGLLAVALRFCDALVTQAPFALMVACLLGLALLIDEECPPNRRLARVLHAAAIPVAVGYLLLIPLYGASHWWRAQAEAVALRQGLQASLDQIQTARQALLRASSSRDLERVLLLLPAGSPPLSRFGSDLPRQRSALLRFFDQVSGILALRLQGLQRQLWTILLRDTALFSLACLALAALFHRCSQLTFSPRRRRLWFVPFRSARCGDPLKAELQRLLSDSGAIEAPLQDPPARPSDRRASAQKDRGRRPSG